MEKSVVISVVNHGHEEQLKLLVQDLVEKCAANIACLVITLNLPSMDFINWLQKVDWPFEVKYIQNTRALGFSQNHNNAFFHCSGEFYCVMNPDIRIGINPFPSLIEALNHPCVGCSYPMQITNSASPKDPARELPTPAALIRRHMGLFRKRSQMAPCWVNASFLLFRRRVYQELNGFDERYFMYCEDVDICLRMVEKGQQLKPSEDVMVHHNASFASRKNIRHLFWHIRSLIAFWASPVYKRSKALRGKRE